MKKGTPPRRSPGTASAAGEKVVCSTLVVGELRKNRNFWIRARILSEIVIFHSKKQLFTTNPSEKLLGMAPVGCLSSPCGRGVGGKSKPRYFDRSSKRKKNYFSNITAKSKNIRKFVILAKIPYPAVGGFWTFFPKWRKLVRTCSNAGKKHPGRKVWCFRCLLNFRLLKSVDFRGS